MGNPRPYRPPSIKDLGGFWVWIDLLYIRAQHNGLGGDDLKLRIRLRVPITEIARDYGVKPNSVRRWLKQGGYVKKDGYYTQDTSTGTEPADVSRDN